MDIARYKSKGFMPFCIEEIKLAYSNGISEQDIHTFMNNLDYDNLQLRQIRLGLEQGLDVSVYARSSMPSKEMEEIRLRLLQEKSNINQEEEKERKLAKEQIKVEVNKQKLKNTISLFGVILILLLIGVAIIIFIVFRHLYNLYNQDLTIKFNTKEVVLEYGESFIPEEYIESCSEGNNIMLIYPSLVIDEIGEYKATYQISNGLKSVKQDLNVRIVDNTKPIIKLKSDEIKLIRDVDEFDSKEYIESYLDNYDENPIIEVDEIDWSLDEQEIKYTIKDSSGNITSASLKVFIEDKPKPKPTVTNTSNNNTSNSQNSVVDTPRQEQNTPTVNDNPKSEQTPQSTGASVSCHNVTVKLNSDPHAAAYSTFDGVSGDAAVSLQYPELNTSVPGTYPVTYINTNTGQVLATAYVTVSE